MTQPKSQQTETPAIKLSLALGLAGLMLIAMLFFSALILLISQLFTTDINSINDVSQLSPLTLASSIVGSILFSNLLILYLSQDYARQLIRSQPKIQPNFFTLALIIGIGFALLVLTLQNIFPPAEGVNLSIDQAFRGGILSKTLVLIAAIGLAPVFEEYLFRGVLFDSLKHQFGVRLAILVSAIIFTLFHLFEYYQYWLAWLAVFCLALMLAILRHKSQSIFYPIIAHIGYNLTLMVVTYFFSQGL